MPPSFNVRAFIRCTPALGMKALGLLTRGTLASRVVLTLVVSTELSCGGAHVPTQAQTEATSSQEQTLETRPRPTPHREKPALPRFISVNIPNLHYIEDDFRFEAEQRYRLPTEFEIRDALGAVQQLGGRVVRIYALSVRKQSDDPKVPRHVLGPGQFDEAAFAALDLVLALCREYGIQVIIPFVDNWQWWGGVAEYAAFRGKTPNAFFSDPELARDFDATLRFVLERTNTLTGERYADDETILAWETGNELQSPWEWVERVATRIKQLDPQHPVIDGLHSGRVRQEALDSPLIDILSTHHYNSAEQMRAEVEQNLDTIAGRKPYFVGEFGFLAAKDLASVLDPLIQRGGLGALIWSLRFRNRDGGFYFHGEKPGFESYHWPGFDAGQSYEERAVLQVLQAKASEIAARPIPNVEPPSAPLLLESSPNALHWRGSAGAVSYRVERARERAGAPLQWQEIAARVSDADVGYRPLFTDTTAAPDVQYFYRLRAENRAGLSAPSNVVGPVSAAALRFVDELVDPSRLSEPAPKLRFIDSAPMNAKMDRGRVAGASLHYQVPGAPQAVRVDCFLEPNASVPTLWVKKGQRFVAVEATSQDFPRGTDLQTALRPVRVQAQLPPGSTRVRIDPPAGSSIGRVEIDYLPAPTL